MNLITTPAPGLAARFDRGVGPAPHSWELPPAERETTICTLCGKPVWADACGALHACNTRKAQS